MQQTTLPPSIRRLLENQAAFWKDMIETHMNRSRDYHAWEQTALEDAQDAQVEMTAIQDYLSRFPEESVPAVTPRVYSTDESALLGEGFCRWEERPGTADESTVEGI